MSKTKIFQDSTQGYISISSEFVAKLIDHFEVQRLKDVCQTGIRPIYSGATHDRFSHSMGVFNLGNKLYSSFVNEVIEEIKNKNIPNCRNIENLLCGKWRILYQIACILHDIGHPAYSHTLEYIYNSDMLVLDIENNKDKELNNQEIIKQYIKRSNENHSNSEKRRSKLWEMLIEKIYIMETGNPTLPLNDRIVWEKMISPAQPHEMMSAYQILSDTSGIQRCITECLQELDNKSRKQKASSLKADFAFIARMIIGAPYDLKTCSANEISELSLKNCIINLLNGKIDADSIDYLNRNSHFAGYATDNLDLTRLCEGFSVSYDKNRFILCIKKSALSALDSFIHAREFEPKWLYSHHKLVYYNDFLIKYLVKTCSVYLFAINQECWENTIIDVIYEHAKSKRTLDSTNIFYLYESVKQLISPYIKQYYKIKNIPNGDLFELTQGIIEQRNDIIKKFKLSSNILLEQKLETLEKKFHTVVIPQQVDGTLKNFLFGFLNFLWEKCCNAKDFNDFLSNYKSFLSGYDFVCSKVLTILSKLKYVYMDCILAPIFRYEYGKNINEYMVFYKSTDSNINTLIKNFYNYFVRKEVSNEFLAKIYYNEKENNVALLNKHKFFVEALEEYQSRNFRKTLFKSYQEYQLFVKDIAIQTHIKPNLIMKAIEELIVKGEKIEFEDTVKSSQNARLHESELEQEQCFTNYFDSSAPSKNQQEFSNVFGFLGQGLVIRFCHCKFKDFSELNVKVWDRLVQYSELDNSTVKANYRFPYMYYKWTPTLSDEEETRNKLKENIIKHLMLYYNEECNMNETVLSFNDGKMIRDAVHGDIFIPQEYLNIINCKVFQRLRRIKQLATADSIFPEAVHTRFAHSLGTFHIMTLMMEHFCRIFETLHIAIDNTEKNAILVAALLHDIGHGPYSHAYESIGQQTKSHEQWTIDIIKNDIELSNVLKDTFGENFYLKVIDCLSHKTTPKENGEVTLSYVFSELISSNLDADRMDYLMRDSLNTGEKYGVFDLQRLISSLELTEYEGKVRVAVRADSLSSVEQFIIGRYNMYSGVYYAPYKLLTEAILKKICERLSSFPIENPFITSVCQGKLSLKEYIELDDYTFVGEIRKAVEESNDEILNEMFNCFMNRGGYERKRILDENRNDYNNFKNELKQMYPTSEKLNYSLINVGHHYYAYKKTANEILIIQNNGIVRKFSQCSKLCRNMATDYLWSSIPSFTYFNSKIFEKEEKNYEQYRNVLNLLFKKFDKNSHTEIENKYFCSQEVLEKAKKLESLIGENYLSGFECVNSSTIKIQKDTYYDTSHRILKQKHFTLRCRVVDGKNIFTIKSSATDDNGFNAMQFVRNEIEQESNSNELCSMHNFVTENLLQKIETPIAIDDLKPVLEISNERTTFLVRDVAKNSGFQCEISLDNLIYDNLKGKKVNDYQMEIELKCNYAYRVRLGYFSEMLCKTLGIKTNDSEARLSKYEKALSVLEL